MPQKRGGDAYYEGEGSNDKVFIDPEMPDVVRARAAQYQYYAKPTKPLIVPIYVSRGSFRRREVVAGAAPVRFVPGEPDPQTDLATKLLQFVPMQVEETFVGVGRPLAMWISQGQHTFLELRLCLCKGIVFRCRVSG